ncbi:MAG TPA: TonB-dependent receptor [Cellvibrio sp.]|nr:TonB-dependent receptor [Cellvibrio sp.]
MTIHENKTLLRNNHKAIFKKSFLAMCIMAATTTGFAQQATTTETTKAKDENLVEEVVITGMRQSLSSAQDLKRAADTVVDSITAKDLGSFPDKSVAEALQRVAGVTVNRFAASSDTSHFSAEPSGVVVRGLNQVRTEFNGRDSFSANSGRGLSWGDISPELMSGVDTYKNQTAELIEGGIAGTVNMRTRVPFDQEGQMAALTLSTNYGDLSESFTPEASGLYSNRWETSAGEFGALINVAYSDVETRTQGIQLNRMNRILGAYGDPDTLNYIPDGENFRDNTYSRERTGVSFATQWQDNDGIYVATLQFNRSEYDNSMEEYVVGPNMGNASYGQSIFWSMKPGGAGSDKIPVPAAGTPNFTFDKNGVFQTGTITMPMAWNTATGVMNDAGEPFVVGCYTWTSCTPNTIGESFTSSTRGSRNQNITQDISLNLKWEISENIHSQWDLSYVESEVTNFDVAMDLQSYTNPTIDLTGDLASVILNEPTNVNWSAGGLANPHNYYLNSIMDHVEDSYGDELAMRADFKFDVNSGVIESVKLGARHTKRDQQVNWSTYNWQNISNTYTDGGSYFFIDSGPDATSGFNGYPDFYSVKKWDSSYGDIHTADGMDTFVFGNIDLLNNQKLLSNTMSTSALNLPVNGWDPVCSNIGDRAGELPGTCFTPSEMVNVEETTNAVYAQLNFGGDDLTLFDRPLSGNVGVRYVRTEDVSYGGEVYPQPANDLTCGPNVGQPGEPAPEVPNKIGCYLSDDDIAFMNSANQTSVRSATHDNVLPSFNLKYDLNDEWLIRFALSRAMSRPDVGNMRNFVSVDAKLPDVSSANDPLWIKDSSGEIVGANVYYSADAQNPYLKPIIADQVDLSVEHYFDTVGSFSATVFAKQFDDYIQSGVFRRDYTNNGVTRTVEVTQPLNGDGAKISGIEVAYQRFFDFLPSPFDGLGVQANYTYIDNSGITNTNITSNTAAGSTQSNQTTDSVQVDGLEGLSDQAYNIVLMYEKNAWNARLAYSWRSEYMVTAVDCCVAVPIWNEAAGYLDGSVRYQFNENINISFKASNLLNQETVLEQQVQDADKGGLRLANASFQNDRRFTATLQLTY